MKRILAAVGAAAVLFFLLGTTASAYEQDEHSKDQQKQENQAKGQHKQQAKRPQQQGKPAQQSKRSPQAKPAQRAQQQAKRPQQQGKPAQQAKRPQQQDKPVQRAQRQGSYHIQGRTQQQALGWQQKRGWLQQGGGWQGHGTWQAEGSSNWQSDHRTWAQRGGYGGYYIPQNSFSLHFGAGHWFRIRTQPVIVAGYPRFRYGGYSFMLVDPWPEAWAQNWYATDDVYIGYNNGYYLYNRVHPGFAIAVSVVL